MICPFYLQDLSSACWDLEAKSPKKYPESCWFEFSAPYFDRLYPNTKNTSTLCSRTNQKNMSFILMKWYTINTVSLLILVIKRLLILKMGYIALEDFPAIKERLIEPFLYEMINDSNYEEMIFNLCRCYSRLCSGWAKRIEPKVQLSAIRSPRQEASQCYIFPTTHEPHLQKFAMFVKESTDLLLTEFAFPLGIIIDFLVIQVRPSIFDFHPLI